MKNHLCPYILPRQPDTVIKGKVKTHTHQVLPDLLSKHFAKVRDFVGDYDHINRNNRPGIHEMRALGLFLYEGLENQTAVMSAIAHSEIEMTRALSVRPQDSLCGD
jgi:hypothetical protein